MVVTPDQYAANEKAFEDAVNKVYESGRVKPCERRFFRESPESGPCEVCAIGAGVVNLIKGEVTRKSFYDTPGPRTCDTVAAAFGLSPDFIDSVTHGFDDIGLRIATDNGRRGYLCGQRLRERWIK